MKSTLKQKQQTQLQDGFCLMGQKINSQPQNSNIMIVQKPQSKTIQHQTKTISSIKNPILQKKTKIIQKPQLKNESIEIQSVSNNNVDIILPQKEPEIVQILPDILGTVVIRYNHYNSKFDTINHTLKSKDIDNEYCLHVAFVGKYQLRLQNQKKEFMEERYDQDGNKLFIELIDNEYILSIDEDEEAEEKRPKIPYVAAKQIETNPNLKKRNVQDITNQLKALGADEIAGRSDKVRQLQEERDLEDILFK